MKKTVTISLASIPFIIEEDAYQALEKYLSEIKSHFKGADGGEVVSDIEARIAEQFAESGKKVISHEEVTRVITSMGSVHEFEGAEQSKSAGKSESSGSTQEEAVPKRKRLYRNPEDKVIAGVASGIAVYAGFDVVWVRLAFVILTFINGFGILIYIAFWLATTEAKSASQRLEMTGTPVTIETIADRVKERVEEVKKERGTFSKIIRLPLDVIATVAKIITNYIFPFVGRILGVILSITAGIALLAVSIAFGILITHAGGEYIDFPLQTVASTGTILVVAIAGYISLAIPFLFLLSLGNMLSLKRKTIVGSGALGLLGVWFIAIVITAIMGFSVGSRVASYVSTAPEYKQTSKNIEELAPFTKIEAHNGIRVVYKQGVASEVSIVGRAKDLDHVSVISKNGVLEIEPVRHEEYFCIFCDFGVPSVTVSAPSVTSFTGGNGVRLEGSNITTNSPVSIFLSNGAHGIFDVHGSSLNAEINNGVYLELSGSTTVATLHGENGTRINASKFESHEATIDASNASEVEIGVTAILNAKARNGASIKYAGSPTISQDAKNGSEITNDLKND